MGKEESCNVRPNEPLLRKLCYQALAHAEKGLGKITNFTLTHDEIDAWRNQFDGLPMPVSQLCYCGIPIAQM